MVMTCAPASAMPTGAENVRRALLARSLAEQGSTVIAAFITPRESHRQMVRDIVGESALLVQISCPLSVCEAREPKGLYARAREHALENMTGIHAEFESPSTDAPSVRTDEMSIELASTAMLRLLKRWSAK
jgi:adenylylsulfate kinase-like enzyme